MKVYPLPAAMLTATALLLSACGGDHHHDADQHVPPAHMEDFHDHSHAHSAPRGGALVELGDHVAHLEAVVDHEEGRLSVFVLDGEAENPIRLGQTELEGLIRVPDEPPFELILEARANELTGETAGNSSEFTTLDPRFRELREFAIRIDSISVLGTEFTSVTIPYPEGTEGNP